MNRPLFGVVVKEWRFKMLRNCVLLVMTVIIFRQADAGLLPETPKPQGGNLTGPWVAEKVKLNAYVPAGLVQAVSPLTVEGEINGTVTFGLDGIMQANYRMEANVSAVLLVPLSLAVHDMSQYKGNYTIASDTHELIITRENEDPLNYTYTATADSLHIIRPLLLDELLASLSEAVRPLAMSLLSQHVPPDDPIRLVISFAKATDTGTPGMLTGDFDGNGVVGIPDFLLFVNHFGASRGDGTYDAKYDLDGNGEIGIPDFLVFINNFGKEVSSPGDGTTMVAIPDANLRAVIENSLGKTRGAPITKSEMVALTSVEAPNKNIRDLTGLEFAINLIWLDLANNNISDISALSGLSNLESLSLFGNNISDISALSGLSNLESLSLFGNSISDISALSGLTNLETLSLFGNSISDISALSGLVSLETLSLANNNISDVSALSGLVSLETLYLYNNNISDIAPLVANAGLSSGDIIDVRNNPLSATSLNTLIPVLQGRGVDVRFGALKPAVGELGRDIPPAVEGWEAGDYIYRRQKGGMISPKSSLPTKAEM